MRRDIRIVVLAVLGGVLLLVSSVAGIVFDDEGRPYPTETVRGNTVEIYGGDGLYKNDTVMKAVTFRGFDWANLFVCLPLVLWTTYGCRHRRPRGALLLGAVFAYLAYNYLIGVMGNAYNPMFIVWTALYSIGLFGLSLVIAGLDILSLPDHISSRFPRRSLSIYLAVLAIFLASQYLTQIASALMTGSPPPELGHYTTLELAALELGFMIPLHLVGAVLLWRRRPVGYLLGAILVFTALMTFVSLSVAAFISLFAYGIGGIVDVMVPAILTLIAAAFSLAVFMAVGGGEPPDCTE